jgi:hypothetical protein
VMTGKTPPAIDATIGRITGTTTTGITMTGITVTGTTDGGTTCGTIILSPRRWA